MVRKDPRNERGPAPKGGRPKPDLRTEVSAKRIQVPQTLFQMLPVEEYQKVWRFACIGCSSVIGLIEGYAEIGVPEIPVEVLEDFVSRLQTIIEREKNALSSSPSETSVLE